MHNLEVWAFWWKEPMSLFSQYAVSTSSMRGLWFRREIVRRFSERHSSVVFLWCVQKTFRTELQFSALSSVFWGAEAVPIQAQLSKLHPSLVAKACANWTSTPALPGAISTPGRTLYPEAIARYSLLEKISSDSDWRIPALRSASAARTRRY